jgi:membrane fusion protein (multidrug efflux system)
LLQDRQGKYVFVLGTDNKVSRRAIVTGARIGNRWAVTSGVKQGEQIVTQGLQRIADQQLVAPREANDGEGAEQ